MSGERVGGVWLRGSDGVLYTRLGVFGVAIQRWGADPDRVCAWLYFWRGGYEQVGDCIAKVSVYPTEDFAVTHAVSDALHLIGEAREPCSCTYVAKCQVHAKSDPVPRLPFSRRGGKLLT